MQIIATTIITKPTKRALAPPNALPTTSPREKLETTLDHYHLIMMASDSSGIFLAIVFFINTLKHDV